MDFVLTNAEMRSADEYTIKTLGVASTELMERAGLALADLATELAPSGKMLCVCGGGNNGGDGFVCARILKERGRAVETVCFADKLSDDCAKNRARWLALGGEILTEVPNEQYALVVDCLFGTGLRGGLDGKTAEAVNKINALRSAGAKVLSADIPSGLCGDNGLALGAAVCADVTLCIGEKKAGALLQDGLDLAGEVRRADIGIVLPSRGYATVADQEAVKAVLPKRKRNSHKGSYGKAAIVGGSLEYTGAPYLAAAGCLRSGAGYTTLYVPKSLLQSYVLALPEILLRPVCDGERFAFETENLRELLGYDAVAYGTGMGVSEAVALGAEFLLREYTGKLVLDADGLNSLAKYKTSEFSKLFSEKKCDVLLTPHVKEYARLTGKTVDEILQDGVYATREFCSKYQINVLLKNASSVLSDGDKTVLIAAGCSGQAKGGSGDALLGVIAGLCASGASAFDGGLLGAELVGKAAELAAAEIGEYSLTASDVIAYLGRAFSDYS